MSKKMTIAEAFDIVPTDGMILLRAPMMECLEEAERRNARSKSEKWSIAAVQVGATMSVVVKHWQVW